MPNNILIVEDNTLQQSLYNALAAKFGLSIQLVSNCVEAVEALGSDVEYNFVLMDLGLADLDGCGCTKKIRELEASSGRHTPIIAVTGHASEEYKQRCFEAGMDDFLSKPFTVDLFLSTLRKWSTESSKQDS